MDNWSRIAISSANAERGRGHRLTVGAKRSYGDVCVLSQGEVNSSLSHDRFVAWVETERLLTANAGMTIGALCDWASARGCFPPVVPGTGFATLGGCVANDVHGKNHHQLGSFGCHVTAIKLRREGEWLTCSQQENRDLFYATIGGLGLTGEIGEVSLRLIAMPTPWFNVWQHRFYSLDEWFTLDHLFLERSPYSVAWVDCTSQWDDKVRGILSLAEPCSALPEKAKKPSRAAFRYPFNQSFSWINPYTGALFNRLYWAIPRANDLASQHYAAFLFPLDRLLDWNRLYGRKGFFQFQCVVPLRYGRDALTAMIRRIRQQGEVSPLAVLKRLGGRTSGGLLAFPREGYTLAIDLPYRHEGIFKLMRDLERICAEFLGAIYPAKDASMSAENFRKFYPQWEQLEALRERGRTSDFWERVTPH